MNKGALVLISILLYTFSFGQTYIKKLEKVNEFLESFDSNKYKGMSVRGGYLYNNFSGGDYSKALISNISEAVLDKNSKDVRLKCKSSSCVYSSITKQYHDYFSFTSRPGIDLNKLAILLNKFIAAYKKEKPNENNEEEIDFAAENEKLKSLESNIRFTNEAPTLNTLNPLEKLNNYFKTFDNGYYGQYEIKGDVIYAKFKNGKTNHFKLSDIDKAAVETEYNRVVLLCKNNNKCIYSEWTLSYHEYAQFIQEYKPFEFEKLADLLNKFLDYARGISNRNN